MLLFLDYFAFTHTPATKYTVLITLVLTVDPNSESSSAHGKTKIDKIDINIDNSKASWYKWP